MGNWKNCPSLSGTRWIGKKCDDDITPIIPTGSSALV
jgi:hypothetical protein